MPACLSTVTILLDEPGTSIFMVIRLSTACVIVGPRRSANGYESIQTRQFLEGTAPLSPSRPRPCIEQPRMSFESSQTTSAEPFFPRIVRTWLDVPICDLPPGRTRCCLLLSQRIPPGRPVRPDCRSWSRDRILCRSQTWRNENPTTVCERLQTRRRGAFGPASDPRVHPVALRADPRPSHRFPFSFREEAKRWRDRGSSTNVDRRFTVHPRPRPVPTESAETSIRFAKISIDCARDLDGGGGTGGGGPVRDRGPCLERSPRDPSLSFPLHRGPFGP
eukprot:scaffold363_cov331-Pavlova_lutheri.AAC.18